MESKGTGIRQTLKKVPEEIVDSNSPNSVIKEKNSWVFTFSPLDKCIFLGTPALQSFRLKLTKDDLEELLELLYQKTGEDITMRKLQLSAEELPELIEKVSKIIETKKSKIALKFESDELMEISNIINSKLLE
jgi:hypothetical protein